MKQYKLSKRGFADLSYTLVRNNLRNLARYTFIECLKINNESECDLKT